MSSSSQSWLKQWTNNQLAKSIDLLRVRVASNCLKSEKVMTEKIKYDNHEAYWENVLTDDERKKVGITWLEQSPTLDRWRHDRMYDCLKPIVEFDSGMRWLTVGDVA